MATTSVQVLVATAVTAILASIKDETKPHYTYDSGAGETGTATACSHSMRG